MDNQEHELLKRIEKHQDSMASSLKSILDVLVKERPSMSEKFLTFGTGVAAIIGIVGAIDIILKWIAEA